MSNIVWVCGKTLEGENAWEFQGVFSSEELAVRACVTDQYFVGDAVLDEPLPDETQDWLGAYHPLARGAFGIYNNVEGRWEYDFWGNAWAFSDRILANTQANACWHQFSGCSRAYNAAGNEIIPVMEVIELTEKNYREVSLS